MPIEPTFSQSETESAMLGIYLSFGAVKTPLIDWKDSLVKSLSPSTNTAIPFYKKGDIPGKANPAGHVILTDKEILVCYRGTANNSEILSDISTRPTAMDFNGKKVDVHAGFKYEFEQSENNMNQAIEEARKQSADQNLPITFSGHSMGAAVAQIAGLKHKALNPESAIKVITFGGPRVFANNAVDFYNKLLGSVTLRVKQTGDPVPQLPPKGLFAHTGFHKITASAAKDKGTHMPDVYLDICREVINSSVLERVATRAELLEENDRLRQEKQNLGKAIRTNRVNRVFETIKNLTQGNIKEAREIIFNTQKRTELIKEKKSIIKTLKSHSISTSKSLTLNPTPISSAKSQEISR